MHNVGINKLNAYLAVMEGSYVLHGVNCYNGFDIDNRLCCSSVQ